MVLVLLFGCYCLRGGCPSHQLYVCCSCPIVAILWQSWDAERVAEWFEHALGLPEATEACLSRQLSGQEVMDLFLAPQETQHQDNLGATGTARLSALQSFEDILRIDDATKREAVWTILDCISRRT